MESVLRSDCTECAYNDLSGESVASQCFEETEFPALSNNKNSLSEGFQRGRRNLPPPFSGRRKQWKRRKQNITKKSQMTGNKPRTIYYRPADDLWSFSFRGILERRISRGEIPMWESHVTRIDDAEWELEYLNYEEDEYFCSGIKKEGQRSKRGNKRYTAISQLREKCLREENIFSIKFRRKKVFIKSDVSYRRDKRKTYLVENWGRQKQNVENDLRSRGLTRAVVTTVQHIDISALQEEMPTTASQQRKLRNAKRVKLCDEFNSNCSKTVISTNGKERLKPRWKVKGQKPLEPQPQKYELHQNNIKLLETGSEENVLQHLINIQHRTLTPEDYEVLLRLDESVAPKTVDNIKLLDTGSEENVLLQLINIQHRELTPEDYELLVGLDETVAPKTIDRHCLEKLMVVAIDEQLLENISETSCSVCLDELCAGQRLKYLPCGHFYHENCIDNWLLSCDTKCPLDGIAVS
ncbi:hypothetical protein BSL78_01073 [Apostichopus japonicus]|uniref:RING-type domain-containing protein n=1 Tax=Stichopus japonicus TaxID=307972 RepID=A0A2G8LPC5_STIJA|nr:hypothetical protein BSL78_01073 [Apostichopus japonicus]